MGVAVVILLFCKAGTNISFSLQEKTHLLETSFALVEDFVLPWLLLGKSS